MDPVTAGIAGVGVIGNLAGGWMASNAAKKAAREQADAIREATAFQKEVYGDTKANTNPYIEQGIRASGTYEDKLNNMVQPELNYTQEDFQFDKFADPGAQFQAQQAAQAQQASALAKGQMGGGFAKALQSNQNNLANTAYSSAYDRWLKNSQLKYGQASDQYNRDFQFQGANLDRWGNLSTQGLTAAQIQSGAGQSAANNMGQLQTELGQSQASGTLGSADAWNKAWSGVGTNILKGAGAYLGADTTKNPWGDYFTGNGGVA
jgi:hypothetical protein